MQRHRPLSPPSRSQMSLSTSRMPAMKSHAPYSRKRSHSPMPDHSKQSKLQRDYGMKMDNLRYHDSRKDIYDNSNRDLDTSVGRKSRSSSNIKYKVYPDNQGSRGSYSLSHESRISKSSSLSRERPLEHDHRIESRSSSSRREPSPLYSSKEVSKSYISLESEKRYYAKSYDSHQRVQERSYNDIYSEKDETRPEIRNRSPADHYKQSEKLTARDSGKLSYNREDLEKIKVDIRRNVKDPSPTRRAIVRPEEVKIVRRNDEGNRPLFSREEIRNPAVDLREDALLERRVISVKPTVEERDVGRIRAHRDIDKNPTRNTNSLLPYSEVSTHPSMTLSQRWQGYDSRKASSRLLSPEPDSRYRERSPEKLSRSRVDDSHARGSRDRFKERSSVKDYRSSYSVDSPNIRKDIESYHAEEKKYATRLSSERKEEYYSHKETSNYRSRSRGEVDTRPTSRYDSSERTRQDSGRSPEKMRSLSRDREKSDLPDFSQRPDRYRYDNRLDKPDSIPKGSNYYEVDKNHDDRNRSIFRPRGRGRGFRSRGSPRGTRSRGRNTFYRGRNYRGSRGSFNGTFKRTKSPSLWEHDMFNKMSPSSKSEEMNPSSTT